MKKLGVKEDDKKKEKEKPKKEDLNSDVADVMKQGKKKKKPAPQKRVRSPPKSPGKLSPRTGSPNRKVPPASPAKKESTRAISPAGKSKLKKPHMFTSSQNSIEYKDDEDANKKLDDYLATDRVET